MCLGQKERTQESRGGRGGEARAGMTGLGPAWADWSWLVRGSPTLVGSSMLKDRRLTPSMPSFLSHICNIKSNVTSDFSHSPSSDFFFLLLQLFDYNWGEPALILITGSTWGSQVPLHFCHHRPNPGICVTWMCVCAELCSSPQACSGGPSTAACAMTHWRLWRTGLRGS